MSQNFAAIHAAAHEAGHAAATACQPTPMVVGSAASLFGNQIDRSKPVYHVPEGPCGFAWVAFKGNTAFGRWAKKAGLARPAYPKGLQIWVSAYGQSYERKAAYASTYAKVLRDNGVDAWPDSRLD